MTSTVQLLSIVVPAFNEEKNLPLLVGEIREALDESQAWELIVVDDGSTDSTGEVLARLAADEPRLRILSMSQNSGQSAGFDVGFQAARGEVVVTLDADLQNDPADIPALLEHLDGWDVVCGIRQKRRDNFVRRVSSKIANGVRNRLTRETVTDVGCTLRAMRREFLVDLPMFTGLHRFLPTLLKLQGARVREIPVNHRPRKYGVAKYNISNRAWAAFVDLFAVRWMQRRWIDRRRAREITPRHKPTE